MNLRLQQIVTVVLTASVSTEVGCFVQKASGGWISAAWIVLSVVSLVVAAFYTGRETERIASTGARGDGA